MCICIPHPLAYLSGGSTCLGHLVDLMNFELPYLTRTFRFRAWVRFFFGLSHLTCFRGVPLDFHPVESLSLWCLLCVLLPLLRGRNVNIGALQITPLVVLALAAVVLVLCRWDSPLRPAVCPGQGAVVGAYIGGGKAR